MKNFLFFLALLAFIACQPTILTFSPDERSYEGYQWFEGGYAAPPSTYFAHQVGAERYLVRTDKNGKFERVKPVVSVGGVRMNDTTLCLAFKVDFNAPWEIITQNGDTVVPKSVGLLWFPEKITATSKEITLHGNGIKKWIEKSK